MPQEWIENLQAQGDPAAAEPIDVLLAGSTWPRAEGRRLVSPVTHVTAGAPPFLLVHGENDGLVPIGQSEALLAALQAANVESELVRVPGADHVFLGTDPVPQIEAGRRLSRREADRVSVESVAERAGSGRARSRFRMPGSGRPMSSARTSPSLSRPRRRPCRSRRTASSRCSSTACGSATTSSSPASRRTASASQVFTYDVASLLRPGANRVEVLLSDGWFRGRHGFERQGRRLRRRDRAAPRDRRRAGPGRDGCRVAVAPEPHHARRPHGWAGCRLPARRDDRPWAPVVVASGGLYDDRDRLVEASAVRVRRIETLEPVATTRPRDGHRRPRRGSQHQRLAAPRRSRSGATPT